MNYTANSLLGSAIKNAVATNEADIKQLAELLKSAKLNDKATAYFEAQLTEKLEANDQIKQILTKLAAP